MRSTTGSSLLGAFSEMSIASGSCAASVTRGFGVAFLEGEEEEADEEEEELVDFDEASI